MLKETKGRDYEIIFVDDGSIDETSRLIDKLAATDPLVKVIHHPTKLGYGAAIEIQGSSAVVQIIGYYHLLRRSI